ncbi:MAG TPA: type II toxin-antitoxin system RatA family toxin [Burkholderiales bacterium]|nr:type II toxin-antitoxin system RatA family toxin [Burkholderiales bacterium]
MRRISRSAIVPHSAQAMFALVDDIESYPRFLPWCVGAAVHERSPGSVRATLTAGLRGLRQSFTTLNELRPPASIELRLVHGPFRRFAGAWRFEALSPHACRVEFSLEYELSGPLAALLQRLFDRIADSMVDAFTRRADEVYGTDPG